MLDIKEVLLLSNLFLNIFLHGKNIHIFFHVACRKKHLAFYVKWPLLNTAVCCGITPRCLIEICLYFEKKT
jgi:hypothetical protein